MYPYDCVRDGIKPSLSWLSGMVTATGRTGEANRLQAEGRRMWIEFGRNDSAQWAKTSELWVQGNAENERERVYCVGRYGGMLARQEGNAPSFT